MQALEGVLDCARESDYVLELLKGAKIIEVLKGQEAYIWDYCGPSLQATSRMAYACFHDRRLLSLLRCYQEDGDHYITEFIRYDVNSIFDIKSYSSHKKGIIQTNRS